MIREALEVSGKMNREQAELAGFLHFISAHNFLMRIKRHSCNIYIELHAASTTPKLGETGVKLCNVSQRSVIIQRDEKTVQGLVSIYKGCTGHTVQSCQAKTETYLKQGQKRILLKPRFRLKHDAPSFAVLIRAVSNTDSKHPSVCFVVIIGKPIFSCILFTDPNYGLTSFR